MSTGTVSLAGSQRCEEERERGERTRGKTAWIRTTSSEVVRQISKHQANDSVQQMCMQRTAMQPLPASGNGGAF